MYFRKILLLLCLLFSSILHADAQVDSVVVPRKETPSFVGYVPDEIVVRFRAGLLPYPGMSLLKSGRTGHPGLDSLARKYRVKSIRQQFQSTRKKRAIPSGTDLADWYKIRFSATQDILSVADAYRQEPDVEEVQLIGIHAVSLVPNDGNFSSQWHLDQTEDHDVDAPEAWDLEVGNPGVIVAVLDTGVRYFHKDLGGSQASYSHPENAEGNMWINDAEKEGAVDIDDDGNGYIDDWIGWDFVNHTTSCWSGEDCLDADNDPRDFNGHGTHCAGIIGAITNNGYATAGLAGGWGSGGLSGAADGVRIMALRVGWSDSYRGQEVGYVRMDYAAEALRYASDNGARIASCSWGASDTGGIGAAIDYYLENGGVIFKAAGNDNITVADDVCQRDDVICVAATDDSDCKSDFSNYGTWVDFSAPGSDILSSYHMHDDPAGDYVAYMSGTSMATPLAASAAALIWSQAPGGMTAEDMIQLLYDKAQDLSGLSCNTAYSGMLGAGQVNPRRSIAAYIQSVPALSFMTVTVIIAVLLLVGRAHSRRDREAQP